jgi:hypothetical protein
MSPKNPHFLKCDDIICSIAVHKADKYCILGGSVNNSGLFLLFSIAVILVMAHVRDFLLVKDSNVCWSLFNFFTANFAISKSSHVLIPRPILPNCTRGVPRNRPKQGTSKTSELCGTSFNAQELNLVLFFCLVIPAQWIAVPITNRPLKLALFALTPSF